MAKKIDIEILLERIEALESRLDKLDPVSKRKLPNKKDQISDIKNNLCLLYTSPSPRDRSLSRMPSSA